MTKISIIIPIYNSEKYLRECLDSILNQTLNDFEVLCMYQTSTDETFNILQEYQNKDSRTKIIELETPNIAKARNKGIDEAVGEYLMFVDSDDFLELDACELAYNQIKKNDNDFVIFNYNCYDEASGKKEFRNYRTITLGNNVNNPNIKIRKFKQYLFRDGYMWGGIYNTDFIKRNNIKCYDLKIVEDLPFCYEVYMYADDMSVIKRALYNYRIRLNSETWNFKYWDCYLKAKKMFFNKILETKNLYSLSFFFHHAIYSNILWYFKIPKEQKKLKKEYKEQFIKDLAEYSQYKKSLLIPMFLLQTNLLDFYWKIIRPLGKYLIVLPYRKVKCFFEDKFKGAGYGTK